jgi:pilus assembly protein CpaD
MVRFRNIVPVLLIGSSLAACTAGQSVHGAKPAWVSNRSYNPENQPVVEHTNYVLDVNSYGGGLSKAELTRLSDWFQSLDLRYGDHIYVADPYANPRVRADIAKAASAYGLQLSDGAPVTAGAPHPGSTRVIVRRADASVPGCPNWRQAKLIGSLESTESNYGCAVNSNIAAMVANPDDLVLGHDGAATGDPDSATKAITTYRNATPTGSGGLKEVSTKEGGK